MPDEDDETPPPDAEANESGASPTPRRRRRVLQWVLVGLGVFLLGAGGFGWWLYDHLNGNIRTQDFADRLSDRPPGTGALNVLLVGSDSRAGENSQYGRDESGDQRSDTTILLHVPQGRKSAIALSFPRDLMVEVPSCTKTAGGTQPAYFGQFNSAMEVGGVPCVVATVERLTGARVDNQITIDFTGFKHVVDALGGIPMHIDQPIDDKAAHLQLPAGDVTLNGEQALGFVRVRKSLGDGSDIQRIERQQEFLKATIRKVQSEDLLTNPTKAYNVMDATTKAITTDSGINTLKSLYDFVNGLRQIPLDKIDFVTTPITTYAPDPNRVALKEPEAARLFTRLRDGAPATWPREGGTTPPATGTAWTAPSQVGGAVWEVRPTPGAPWKDADSRLDPGAAQLGGTDHGPAQARGFGR